jgi:ankyrin repeat protein
MAKDTHICLLLEASAEGDIQGVRDKLGADSPSVNLNCRNESGDTPLLLAARHGREELVRLLLENGADVNAVNQDGDNVLFAAAECPDNVSVLDLLLRAGAKINARNKMGRTALIGATSIGDLRNVAFLLKQEPDIDAVTDEEETALTFAVVWEYPDVVKALIEAGANVSWQDSHGWTALKYALQEGNEEIIRLVRKASEK